MPPTQYLRCSAHKTRRILRIIPLHPHRHTLFPSAFDCTAYKYGPYAQSGLISINCWISISYSPFDYVYQKHKTSRLEDVFVLYCGRWRENSFLPLHTPTISHLKPTITLVPTSYPPTPPQNPVNYHRARRTNAPQTHMTSPKLNS